MFASIKNKFKRDKMIRLAMAAFAALTATPQTPYTMVPEKDADEMVAAEPTLVACRKDIKGEGGTVAFGVTTLGAAEAAKIAAAQAQAAATAPAPAAPKQEFKLETGIVVPPAKRGGVRVEVYPFDKMEVNQSFFVASTEQRKNPAKALASTVSSATKRYKGQTPERKFTIRAVEEAGVKGARIWRTV